MVLTSTYICILYSLFHSFGTFRFSVVVRTASVSCLWCCVDDDDWPGPDPIFQSFSLATWANAHRNAINVDQMNRMCTHSRTSSTWILVFTVKWASIIVIINQSIQWIYPFTLVKHIMIMDDDDDATISRLGWMSVKRAPRAPCYSRVKAKQASRKVR